MEESKQPEDLIIDRLRVHGIFVCQKAVDPRDDEWYVNFMKGDQLIEQIGPLSNQEIYIAILTWLIDRYEEADGDRKDAWRQIRELKGYAAYPKNKPIYDDQPPGPFAQLLG